MEDGKKAPQSSGVPASVLAAVRHGSEIKHITRFSRSSELITRSTGYAGCTTQIKGSVFFFLFSFYWLECATRAL